LYFSSRGVEFEKVFSELLNAEYIFLFPAIVLILSVSFIRSLRFGILLSPIEKISQRTLFPINCIGFMAIALIPMRIGELIRPYLVSSKTRVPFSSALATIFVERVLDAMVLLTMFLFVITYSQLPQWIVKAVYSVSITFLSLLLFILFLHFKTETALKLLSPLFSRLSENLKIKIIALTRTFADGFKIVGNPKRLFYTIFLSCLIWGFLGLATYSLFFFLNLRLALLSAFVVLLITVIGISLPTAPAFLGNFQFGCILALSYFNVPKADAFSFSVIYYFSVVIINVLLGVIFLPFVTFSFVNIKKFMKDKVSLKK
jgi:uncharacterized protein (TIRG00374 family)